MARFRDVPRKGNVDRNEGQYKTVVIDTWTFPARGTWIEMSLTIYTLKLYIGTFPARGTWIEMIFPPTPFCRWLDVPRKGNVDRNSSTSALICQSARTFPARGTWIEIAPP